MKEQGINLLEKLEDEIEQQTRNGRAKIYVETKDLKELGYKKIEATERQFIDVITLMGLMRRYEFRQDLKIDVKPVENKVNPDEVMRKRSEEQWEK